MKGHGAAVQPGVNAGEGQGLPLGQRAVIVRIRKGQGQDAGIDEVGGVDPGKALGNDRPDAQIQRHQRGVLTGGALTVVAAAH